MKAQIDVVQSFVAQGVSGITLCPLSETGLASVVHQAVESKIPVLVMDSDLKGTEHISFIATDNYKGGQMGGEALAKLLGGKGNVMGHRAPCSTACSFAPTCKLGGWRANTHRRRSIGDPSFWWLRLRRP